MQIHTQIFEKDLVRWGYRVIWGKTQREALLVLGSVGAPVLALIDEAIDEEYGLSIIRALRKRSQAPYQYLIVLCTNDEKKNKEDYCWVLMQTLENQYKDLSCVYNCMLLEELCPNTFRFNKEKMSCGHRQI